MTFSFGKFYNRILVHFKSRAIVHSRDNNSFCHNYQKLRNINFLGSNKFPLGVVKFSTRAKMKKIAASRETGGKREPVLFNDDNKGDIAENMINAMEKVYDKNPVLAKQLSEELKSVSENTENILMVGTDGEYAVTIIYVPKSVMDKDETMMLLPSANEVSVLAAVSTEYIEKQNLLCKTLEEAGLEEMADEMWERLMNNLLTKAVAMHEKNPQVI